MGWTHDGITFSHSCCRVPQLNTLEDPPSMCTHTCYCYYYYYYYYYFLKAYTQHHQVTETLVRPVSHSSLHDMTNPMTEIPKHCLQLPQQQVGNTVPARTAACTSVGKTAATRNLLTQQRVQLWGVSSWGTLTKPKGCSPSPAGRWWAAGPGRSRWTSTQCPRAGTPPAPGWTWCGWTAAAASRWCSWCTAAQMSSSATTHINRLVQHTQHLSPHVPH